MKCKNKSVLTAFGSAVAIGVVISLGAGSAAVSDGAFTIKAMNSDNPSIFGTAGTPLSTGVSNPEEPGEANPGGSGGPNDPEHISKNIPEISDARKFYAVGSDVLWGSYVVNNKGEAIPQREYADTIFPADKLQENEHASPIGYDPQGRVIFYTSIADELNSTVTEKIIRKSGNTYEDMGEVTKPLYLGSSKQLIAPNGDLYHVVSMLEETTVYKSVNNKMEVFEVIPDGNMVIKVLAIDSNGTIGYSNGYSFMIHGLDNIDALSNPIDATPLAEGGFAVATEDGLSLSTAKDEFIDFFEVGKVTNVATGANGRIAYTLVTVDDKFGTTKHEVRSYDPSTGKHILWATSGSRIDY